MCFFSVSLDTHVLPRGPVEEMARRKDKEKETEGEDITSRYDRKFTRGFSKYTELTTIGKSRVRSAFSHATY